VVTISHHVDDRRMPVLSARARTGYRGEQAFGGIEGGGGPMILLRRVIGDALRARRQSQQRTLREVSTAANVSLGYLSEIERGQKEASSELLAAICEALGAQLSELLREVSFTVADVERVNGGAGRPALTAAPSTRPVALPEPIGIPDSESFRAAAPAIVLPKSPKATRVRAVDGDVSVSIRQSSPLKATLRTTRNTRKEKPGRDHVMAI
jgi:transcriptional regulator with XRE-family HTH domain